jgi:hypothetical protein
LRELRTLMTREGEAIMLKRRLLIGALAFGTFFGYAAGFMSLGAHAAHCHAARRAAFESHVADVCTRSAHRVWDGRTNAAGRSDRPLEESRRPF